MDPPTDKRAPAAVVTHYANEYDTPVSRSDSCHRRAARASSCDAALDLFSRQGFEATTVEEITEAVDVSRRTFSRYFAGKEEAVLAVERAAQAEILELARKQSPDISPVRALCEAYLEFVGGFRHADRADDLDRYLKHGDLMHNSPSLAARSAELALEKQGELAAIIAARIGADRRGDPLGDLRPQFIVAVWDAALRIVWRSGPGRVGQGDRGRVRPGGGGSGRGAVTGTRPTA